MPQVPLFNAMLQAMGASLTDLRKTFDQVKYAGYVDANLKPVPASQAVYQRITFTKSGKPFEGFLKGRNEALVIGFGKDFNLEREYSQAIALRVFLDGDSRPILVNKSKQHARLRG